MKCLLPIILSLFLILPTSVRGQNNYAFFYFEGDQQTPIYVKVEGQMQPRYGMNHFIIPNLGAGYTHFEILFQQNKYPPQKYLLKVPNSGFRGFVLKKINANQFALYDLQQKKYIMPGDLQEKEVASSDSTIPDFNNRSSEVQSTPVAQNEPESQETINSNTSSDAAPDRGSDESKRKQRRNLRLSYLKDTLLKKLETPVQSDSVAAVSKQKDVFMNNVVINGNSAESPASPYSETPSPKMNEDAFEAFAERLLNQEDDEGKIKLIKKEMQNHSFSTEQVRVVAQNLSGQAARYDAVKMLYSHTVDPGNYSKLEFLFNTPFLKNKFLQILDNRPTK